MPRYLDEPYDLEPLKEGNFPQDLAFENTILDMLDLSGRRLIFKLINQQGIPVLSKNTDDNTIQVINQTVDNVTKQFVYIIIRSAADTKNRIGTYRWELSIDDSQKIDIAEGTVKIIK